MDVRTGKSTYSLDAESVRILEVLAKRWAARAKSIACHHLCHGWRALFRRGKGKMGRAEHLTLIEPTSGYLILLEGQTFDDRSPFIQVF